MVSGRPSGHPPRGSGRHRDRPSELARPRRGREPRRRPGGSPQPPAAFPFDPRMTHTHRRPHAMPALAAVQDSGGSRAPASPAAQQYRSNAKWAKPMPRAHANFIPAQSWLAYNWIDKDPELEFVLHAIEESGWSLEKIEKELSLIHISEPTRLLSISYAV